MLRETFIAMLGLFRVIIIPMMLATGFLALLVMLFR